MSKLTDYSIFKWRPADDLGRTDPPAACMVGWTEASWTISGGFLWGTFYFLHLHVPLLKAAEVCPDILLV